MKFVQLGLRSLENKLCNTHKSLHSLLNEFLETVASFCCPDPKNECFSFQLCLSAPVLVVAATVEVFVVILVVVVVVAGAVVVVVVVVVVVDDVVDDDDDDMFPVLREACRKL